MSKTRYIKTDFWSDSFIESLDPVEKLLFIYLFTNDRLDLCGIYEITIRKISFETGINEERVQKTISKFSEKGKIHYIDGYICVMNFTKHLQTNPSVLLGIERSKSLIPKQILEAVTGCDRLGQGGTLIPIPIPGLIPIPKPIPSAETVVDFYEKELQRVTDPSLLISLREWWQYKKGKYKQDGWQKTITIALKYPPKSVCDRIDEAIASGWEGMNLSTIKKEYQEEKPKSHILINNI